MRFLPEDQQQRLLAACYARSHLTPEQLWMRYFALGGSQSLLELDAYLNGLTTLPRVDRDMLAHAVNERLDEVAGPARAPYSHSVRDGRPLHGPLKALVDLLEGAHRAPPERLPAVVAEAGRALDLRIGIYLADYDQRVLVPLQPGAGELDIDSSVAGDVFRHAGTTVSHDGTLWTVLLDGVERLGVLEVTPLLDGADVDDPVLREHCQWLAALLGHLVTVTTQYGDGLDVQRRRRPRGSPAELLWHSLPPLTGATERIVVGASVQPAYDLRGTVFDYALSERQAQLAMFDGGESSAVVSALSAYRAARRDGASLPEQYAAVGAELAARPAVAGLIAELDLHTSVLEWLAAAAGGPRWLGVAAGRPGAPAVHGGRAPARHAGPARARGRGRGVLLRARRNPRCGRGAVRPRAGHRAPRAGRRRAAAGDRAPGDAGGDRPQRGRAPPRRRDPRRPLAAALTFSRPCPAPPPTTAPAARPTATRTSGPPPPVP
jgi:hypothetical protein